MFTSYSHPPENEYIFFEQKANNEFFTFNIINEEYPKGKFTSETSVATYKYDDFHRAIVRKVSLLSYLTVVVATFSSNIFSLLSVEY